MFLERASAPPVTSTLSKWGYAGETRRRTPPSFTLRGRAAVAAGIALALFGLAGVIHGNDFP
jgi:hypothetical protein